MNEYKNMPDPFEKIRKAMEPKEYKFKLDIDCDSPMLDSWLKEVSLDPSHLGTVLSLADRIKKKNPEKYKKDFQERIDAYYLNLLEKANNEWDSGKQKLPDYRNQMRQLYILTLFQTLVDRNVVPEIVAQLTKFENEMRKYIKSHPKELDTFLLSARSEAADRSLTIPLLKEPVEKILELLTVASTKIERIEKNGEADSFTIEHDGEVWEFNLFYQLTVDTDESLIVVRSKKSPEKMAVMPLQKIIAFLEKDNFAGVVSIVDNNYQTEKQYAGLLAKFDLPKSGNIEYIRLTLDEFDPVVTPTFFGSTIFAEGLRQSYPNLKIGAPILTNKPKEDLMARVREAYVAGTRQFFIDIYAHGTEEKLLLGADLQAVDLTTIAKEFPDAKFNFSTIGCYGGGLREGFLQEMEKEPELKQRVALFLQTKPDVPNVIGRRILEKADMEVKKVAPGELTLYQIVLLESLSKGKTFGEAIIDADRESKIGMYVDPETIIEGQLISVAEKNKSDKLT